MKVTAKAVPNPIVNKLTIEAKNFSTGAVKVVIVNENGNTIYNDKRLIVTQTDHINIFLQAKPGNYFCSLSQNEQVAKFRFIVAK